MKNFMQKLGKSLMLPIAILPVVSILFGVGYALDYQGWGKNSILAAILIKAGLALIDNIPIIFAVGIPVGLAKERDGAAALSGLVGYLVVKNLLAPESIAMIEKISVKQVNPAFNQADNVFIGILIGVLASFLYNRFSHRELPAALAFFSGRRLVPILTVLSSVVLSGVMYILWPVLFGALVTLGTSIQKMGAMGAGIYGFLNRLLIPTGLHHALNAVFWFDTVNINDLANFWSSNGIRGITGRYMAGYFPIMMFGLPGAALAMYHTANSNRKKVVGSMLLAASVSAFITGLTEPIEFLFMFISPLLYFVHSLLTGLSMFISASMQWTAGFNFSAGLIDWTFSTLMPLANKPYMLLFQGVFFFGLYYGVFRWFIKKFNLQTPGREAEFVNSDDMMANEQKLGIQATTLTGYDKMAEKIYAGLGGKENLIEIDHCATRVRAKVVDSDLIDRKKIMEAGITNIVVLGKNNVQVIVGTKVQFVVDAMKEIERLNKNREQ